MRSSHTALPLPLPLATLLDAVSTHPRINADPHRATVFQVDDPPPVPNSCFWKTTRSAHSQQRAHALPILIMQGSIRRAYITALTFWPMWPRLFLACASHFGHTGERGGAGPRGDKKKMRCFRICGSRVNSSRPEGRGTGALPLFFLILNPIYVLYEAYA